ncbi:MAG: crossover junction endodeoxyribonuclease RuvC [Oscillospiraceae bacterium]
MVILGVDPGYATTGFGLIRAERGTYALLRYGTVTTPAGLPFPQRLNILFEDMTQLLEVTKARGRRRGGAVLGPQYHDRYRRFARTRRHPARHRAGGRAAV